MLRVDKNANSGIDNGRETCYYTLGSAEDRSNGAWFLIPRPAQTYMFTGKEPSSTTGSVSWQHAHGPQQTPYSSLAFCVSGTF